MKAGEAASADPTLAAIVREQTGLPWSRAKSLCIDGRVTVDGVRCVDPAMRVPAGAHVVADIHAPKLRRGPLPEDAIVHADRDIVVVEKPAGMLSVADEAGNRDTLADHLRTLLRQAGRGDTKLGVVHRLDRDTSGLMVFARNAEAKRVLAGYFREHDIERVYHAIVHGAIGAARIESDLLADRGDGLRGSRASVDDEHEVPRGPQGREGRRSVTWVKPLEALRGATLVECRLETGRQHQIRIHLSERGHPLVGEPVYRRDYRGPVIAASRPMLHARVLGLAHPRHGAPLRFEREPPEDFRAMLAALR